MFYDVAKLFGFFVTLPNAVVLAVILSAVFLLTPFRRSARILVLGSVSLLALSAFSPLGSALLWPLENRFPAPKLDDAPTGLIVLGGMTDETLTVARNAVTLSDAAERLTEAVALSRRYPTMRLVFSGGTANTNATAATESDSARRFWIEMGVAPGRMTFENRSRNTWENGVFTKEIVQPKSDDRWLLVTSAFHMPRSVGIFRKIGFPVIPYPVDYHTVGNGSDFKGLRRAAESFAFLEMATHEWVGLAGYYLTGKTSAPFPAPD